MSSKADKMRKTLLKASNDREMMEKKTKELEEQMNKGKKNLSKIEKGLRTAHGSNGGDMAMEKLELDVQMSSTQHHGSVTVAEILLLLCLSSLKKRLSFVC